MEISSNQENFKNSILCSNSSPSKYSSFVTSEFIGKSGRGWNSLGLHLKDFPKFGYEGLHSLQVLWYSLMWIISVIIWLLHEQSGSY